MKTKLSLLKDYIDKQANDHNLWFRATYPVERYLQEELRRIAWMIEDATLEQIIDEIKKYDGRL